MPDLIRNNTKDYITKIYNEVYNSEQMEKFIEINVQERIIRLRLNRNKNIENLQMYFDP